VTAPAIARPVLTLNEARVLCAYVARVPIPEIGPQLGLDHEFVSDVIVQRGKLRIPAATELLKVAQVINGPSTLIPITIEDTDKPARLAAHPKAATLGITATEIRVLQLVADGFTNQQCADRLRRTLPTIESHLRKVGQKLGATTRTHAITIGLKAGFVTTPVKDGGTAPDLTERELHILRQSSDGLSLIAIGADLGQSAHAIRSAASHLYRKLSVHSRHDAVVAARKLGLIDGGTDV
jgi:DNA-binding NarL/FixJ family response regulator